MKRKWRVNPMYRRYSQTNGNGLSLSQLKKSRLKDLLIGGFGKRYSLGIRCSLGIDFFHDIHRPCILLYCFLGFSNIINLYNIF